MKEGEIRNRTAFAQYLHMVQQDAAVYFSDPGQFRSLGCPACGGKKHAEAFTKAGFRYVKCPTCGTLFVNPRPSAYALMRFYVGSPSSRYWVDSFFQPVAEARRVKVFRPRAAYVAERLPHISDGVIGDVGAGFGLFLGELKQIWPTSRLVAFEPFSEMAALCRSKGLEVVEATIEDATGCEEAFDLITSFELLEHLHEPRALFQKAFEMLRPGGHILVTTLNGEGFDIQILWEKSKSVSPPHHLNFFNPRSLARLCESVGFRVEEVSTPGHLDWDIVEGELPNHEREEWRFWRLLAEYGSEECKQEFQTWITRHSFSSHMRLLARKD
jgi:SAM-dependent methyltransferase